MNIYNYGVRKRKQVVACATLLPAVAVAFLRAAGDARGRTPAGPALDALAAPSRADVSLIVAESTVFCRRKKFVGAAVDEELWFVVDAVVEPVARLVGPVDALVALVPEAVAVVAASRVSPPDEARRPVFEEVADMERWTLRWPPAAALVEPVAVEPLEACDEEWPDEGTKEAGPEVAAADSARGVIPRNDNELPDRDPSLSNCNSTFNNKTTVLKPHVAITVQVVFGLPSSLHHILLNSYLLICSTG